MFVSLDSRRADLLVLGLVVWLEAFRVLELKYLNGHGHVLVCSDYESPELPPIITISTPFRSLPDLKWQATQIGVDTHELSPWEWDNFFFQFENENFRQIRAQLLAHQLKLAAEKKRREEVIVSACSLR